MLYVYKTCSFRTNKYYPKYFWKHFMKIIVKVHSRNKQSTDSLLSVTHSTDPYNYIKQK